MPLHPDLKNANSLMNLYIPISQLTSVMCNNASSQVYIHNYDTDNVKIEPNSSNGIVRL